MNGCGTGAGDDALDVTATCGGNGVANNGGGNVDSDESDDGGGVGRVIAFDAGNCDALLVLRESNNFMLNKSNSVVLKYKKTQSIQRSKSAYLGQLGAVSFA